MLVQEKINMPVTLVTLIKAAPFKEKTRQDLLTRLDKMPEVQKFELADGCWTILAQTYFARLKYERDKLLLEIQEGKRKFDKKDFEQIKERVSKEFAQKLQSAKTEESIHGIRAQLAKYFRKK